MKQLMDAHNLEISNSSPTVEQLTTKKEEINGTVREKLNETGQCSKVPEKKKKQIEAAAIWNDVVTRSTSMLLKASSGKKSWADEVEEEAEMQNKKRSIWDEFNISKLANAWYKLEYVALTKAGDEQIAEIGMEDFQSEVDYWGNALICYV